MTDKIEYVKVTSKPTNSVETWYFHFAQIDGINAMMAVCVNADDIYALKKEDYKKYECLRSYCQIFDYGGKTVFGHVCAYVECTSHIEDVMNCEHMNGGCTYQKHDKEHDTWVSHTEFPDGTKAQEGNIVVGWDYNHGWDEGSGTYEAERDICAFIADMKYIQEHGHRYIREYGS